MGVLKTLTSPRYGIYFPDSQITTDFEYTPKLLGGFKISTSITIGDDETFEKIEKKLKAYLEASKAYLEANDLAILSNLLGGAAATASFFVNFNREGLTLAKIITINAKKVQFIYEKYNSNEYALQFALLNGSEIKFAWAEKGLKGDFYFNLKRTREEYRATVTGYTNFHLGNEAGRIPVILSAGVINREPIDTSDEIEKAKDKVPKAKVKHSYILLRARFKGITIADILRMVTPDTVDIPDALDNIAIYNFAVLKSAQEDVSKSLAIILDCNITINGNELRTKLSIISKTTSAGKKEFVFKGQVRVGAHQFRVIFKKDKQAATGGEQAQKSWSLLADYDSGSTKTTIKFKELATSLFGAEVEDKTPDIAIDLTEFKAFFYYKTITVNGKKENKLLLGLGANMKIDLSKLPVAGHILVDAEALEFKEILVVYAKGTFTKEELKECSLLPEKHELLTGLSLSAQVVVGGHSEYYRIGGTSSSSEVVQSSATGMIAAESSEDLDESLRSKASWATIDKKLGPVNFQRLGLAYDNGKIVALLDAAIEMKTMSLQMMGLGVGFNLDLKHPNPDFHLDGLGLAYASPPIEISGSLLRSTEQGAENSFNGQARIKMKNFTISAVGSYAGGEVQSMFIFGLFEGSIGGPPIFYVTGIAAGFGYNRKINAPDIDEVADYPLVALAMRPEDESLKDNISKAFETKMRSGKRPIEISPGNYWFALGVRFTSFKIIESFLLLTVDIGTQVSFNILGLSRLSWPAQSTRKKLGLKSAIVYVEIAIKASFSTDSDVIKVDGIITPNSYILSKNCKLSGGFAFYTWVSGAHAGDFVLTVGGYHPRFNKPAHYPEVPRIALNWQVTDNLLLKGELYFALTPSAVMMGGKWELLYTTSQLKVSFLMWIDILMQWAPFYYDISIGVIFRIEANIKIKLVTIHLNLELRAELQIWGPPFSGYAVIDLAIFSCEMRFGSKELPKKDPLEWNVFKSGFLPKEEVKPNALLLNANSSDKVDAIAIKVEKGVIQILEDEDSKEKLYVANPCQMTLAIDSGIPVKELNLNNKNTKLSNEASLNNEIGVKPCGYKGEEMTFEMNVTITLGGKKVSNFEKKKVSKSFPESLWGCGDPSKAVETKDPQAPKVIKDVMSGLVLTPVASTEVSQQKEFDFSKLKEEKKVHENIKWESRKNSTEEYNSSEVLGETGILVKEFTNSKSKRTALLDELQSFDSGLIALDEVAIAETFKTGDAYFRIDPLICKIDKFPKYPRDTH